MIRRHVLLSLLLAGILSSCATVTSKLDVGLVPDGRNSIVVGRSQFLYNGVAVTPASSSGLLPPAIMSHVAPFTSVDEINKNSFAPGKWAIKAKISEDGYFAVNLPPGRYYFVEYIYLSLLSGLTGVRSYMSILGSKLYQPVLTTFDVLPGKATYIGTMQHLVNDARESSGATWDWGMRVVDESPAAQDWLRRTYPQWDGTMTTRLAETQALK